MEVYGGAELQLQSFLASALDGDEFTHHVGVAPPTPIPPPRGNNSGYALNSAISGLGGPQGHCAPSDEDKDLLFQNLSGV
jgi:hypothetical protein